MDSNNDENISILSLTDCLYFSNGYCVFKNKCNYRHCQTAVKQFEKCPNWPDSCRNLCCPYRHTGMPSKMPKFSPHRKKLVSFFWDIENVPIPKGQKPFNIVQRIRQQLVIEPDLQEVDFSCYCNINTISKENQESLHHVTVRIIHVPDRKPGAVDRQIMLDLDRFERVHRPPATIVLISGDIDFVGKLSDLRHHAGFHVIVIHNKPAKQELKATVNEHYAWELFIEPSQQQQPPPIIRINSERVSNQPANFGAVLTDRLNSASDVKQPVSPKLRQQPLALIYDSHGGNNLRQNDVLQSKPPTTRRRPRSMARNHRATSRTRSQKPQITQPVNQTQASNAGSNIPPSASPSIVAPRARIRHSASASRSDGSNIPISGSFERILSAINDGRAKKQCNPLSCPYCTNEFNTIKALRQHQKDKNHLFDCPVCKEVFPTKNALKQHQIVKGHNVSNRIDDKLNIQLDTADNSNMHQFATGSEHNLNIPNNSKDVPVSQSPIANYPTVDRNTNNVNYVSIDED